MIMCLESTLVFQKCDKSCERGLEKINWADKLQSLLHIDGQRLVMHKFLHTLQYTFVLFLAKKIMLGIFEN